MLDGCISKLQFTLSQGVIQLIYILESSGERPSGSQLPAEPSVATWYDPDTLTTLAGARRHSANRGSDVLADSWNNYAICSRYSEPFSESSCHVCLVPASAMNM